MARSTIGTLIEIMGDKEWDILTLSTEYNKRRKWGLSPKMLSQKLVSNKEFEVVGNTKVHIGSQETKKSGYRLYAVKPQYLEGGL